MDIIKGTPLEVAVETSLETATAQRQHSDEEFKAKIVERDAEKAARRAVEEQYNLLLTQTQTEEERKAAEATELKKQVVDAALIKNKHDALVADLKLMNDAHSDETIKQSIQMLREAGTSEAAIFRQAELIKSKITDIKQPELNLNAGTEQAGKKYEFTDPDQSAFAKKMGL